MRRTWIGAILGGAAALLLGVAFWCWTPSTVEALASERTVAESNYGTPHGVVKGTARVVAFDTIFHGDPQGRPLAWVNGEFSLRDFPWPAEGRYSSVFFLRDAHLAEQRPLQAVANGEDPDLGLIVLEPLPAQHGGVCGVVAETDPGEQRGIVRYHLTPVEVRPEAGGPGLTIPARGPHFTFSAALPPGRYELVPLGFQPRERTWVTVEEGRCEVVVIEVEAEHPQPEPATQR
ncbi:MAG: hypothetical protein AB7N76_08150 [Planctomycetota bacterium]